VGIPAPSHPPDPRARAIEEHLPLVRAIARRYAGRGEPLDELVQAGCVGLIKAVDRYDPDRGPALAAYAAPAIEGEIRHHLRTQGRHADREAGPALEAIEAGSGEEARSEARLLLAGGWATLSERERRLLELRYFGDLTQAQIAQELGLSQAQVSRLLHATLERLRTQLGDDIAGAGGRAYSATEMATPAPEPEEPKAHSGRLLVRMPPSLHTQLAQTAEREGVSLNTLVTGALAGAVGWRDGSAGEARLDLRNGSSAPAAPDDPAGTPERRRTLLSVALAANFAIVAIAAVLAIVLLIVAWQGG
jgi:RNA polymerase sigma-B factor